MQTRTCSRCKIQKDGREFGKRRRSHDGLFEYCKVCSREIRAVAYGQKLPEEIFAANLQKLHRISVDEYYRMWASQGGKCRLCADHLKETAKRKPPLDHCHKTGKIRGILCFRCNSLLGAIEMPGFVEAAQDYLRRTAVLQEGHPLDLTNSRKSSGGSEIIQ